MASHAGGAVRSGGVVTSPAQKRGVAAGVVVVVSTVPCILVGLALAFLGLIPLLGGLPQFSGEPIDPSTGQKIIGVGLILAGLVVGVLVPVAIGKWARRWARS